MKINIVIPVLNEERALVNGVEKTIKFLDSSSWKSNYIITIADNGSIDRTPEISKELCAKYEKIKYFKVQRRGVGLAFREAIQRNDCDIVGYMDVDLATDLKHLQDVYEKFQNEKAMIVVGSRLAPGAKVVGRSLKREITSRGLNIILHLLLHVKFSDAMCGFKFYRDHTARQLIKACNQIDGWFFCAEMMIRAEWAGLTVEEVAVEWHDDPDSRVKIAKLSTSYLKEILNLYQEKRKWRK